MWDVVLTSGLAVAGTLGGSWLTSRQQAKLQTRIRREQVEETRRQRAIEDVAALQTALANHRRTMTLYEHAGATGADEARLVELRERTHETREAITGLQVRVKLAFPELAGTVDEAVAAVYEIGQSVRTERVPELEVRRQRARDLSDQVTREAAALLTVN